MRCRRPLLIFRKLVKTMSSPPPPTKDRIFHAKSASTFGALETESSRTNVGAKRRKSDDFESHHTSQPANDLTTTMTNPSVGTSVTRSSQTLPPKLDREVESNNLICAQRDTIASTGSPYFGKYLLFFARNNLSEMCFDEVRNLARVFSSSTKDFRLRRVPDDGESPFVIVENSQVRALELVFS